MYNTSLYAKHVVQKKHFLKIIFRKSEAIASEFLKDLQKMFQFVIYSSGSCTNNRMDDVITFFRLAKNRKEVLKRRYLVFHA